MKNILDKYHLFCLDHPELVKVDTNINDGIALQVTFCDKKQKECAPDAVIEHVKKSKITLWWFYPTKKYYPQEYGEATLKDIIERRLLEFT